MFFDSWTGLLRVLVVGSLAYAALIVLLRVSGKRTLSKLNAFDLVVTVALGSTFATILLSKDVALAEGVVAFAFLIFSQYAITALSVRFAAVERLVKSEPRLLVYRGRLLHDALRRERVTVGEIRAVARGAGHASLEDIGAMIMETDASLHVLDTPPPANASALEDVQSFN